MFVGIVTHENVNVVFVCRDCACDEWQMTYINTDDNEADLLTKPLASPKRIKFVRKLLHH